AKLNRAITSRHRKSNQWSLNDMKHLKKLEAEVATWQHISVHPTVSGAGNSVSEVQKSGTYMLAGSLTFRFRDQFTMCSWQRVLLKSTAGFPTQAGLHFVSAAAARK